MLPDSSPLQFQTLEHDLTYERRDQYRKYIFCSQSVEAESCLNGRDLGHEIGFLRWLEKEFVDSGLDLFSIMFHNLKVFF